MRHILVPIDFSGDSVHALENAIKYANVLSTNIRLIHVTKKNAVYNGTIDFHDYSKILSNSIDDYFELIINKYKSQLNGSFDYKIREGKVYAEITNQAKYDDALMIIMGTHGMSGFEARWVGSNAFRVVANSACPVITIRLGFEKLGVKKIVMPLDQSNETRQKVPFVTEIAVAFGAEIYLVDIHSSTKKSVIEKLNKYSIQVADYIKKKNVKCYRESLVGDNITDSVLDFAKKTDADLISIMTEQSESTKNFIVGTYAHQMINHSPIPVISFNPI